jgi:hypothetical protein
LSWALWCHIPQYGFALLSKPQNPEAGVGGLGVVVTTPSVINVSVKVNVLRKYLASPWQELGAALER